MLKDNGGTANGGQDASFILSFNISVQDEYTSWRQEFFSATELADNSISGPLADPDFDGSSNLLEYAIGRSPRVGDGSAVTAGTVVSGGQQYLSLSYTRPVPARSLLSIDVTRSTSPALTGWVPGQVVTHSVVPGPGALETVTVRSVQPIASGLADYLRLQVVQP